MKRKITKRAQRRLRPMSSWMSSKCSLKWIETTGVIGPVYDAKAKRRVHRLLLEKSEYHVYLARPKL